MTNKFTFAIEGQEPEARSIFAFESMTNKQKDCFNQRNKVYVSGDKTELKFTKNLSEAIVFDTEDSANDLLTALQNSKSVGSCDWNVIILCDEEIATDEQVRNYIE